MQAGGTIRPSDASSIHHDSTQLAHASACAIEHACVNKHAYLAFEKYYY